MIKRFIRKIIVLGSFVVMFAILAPAPTEGTSGNQNLIFDIGEVLTVSVNASYQPATGDAGQFLRDKVTLSVSTNNGDGFNAFMTTKATTANLVNTLSTSDVIPTITRSVGKSNFPTNRWGYSVEDNEEETVDNPGYLKIAAMGETPNTVINATGINLSNNIVRKLYFGTKIDSSKPAGVYSAAVVFSVVTGVISNDNPVTPVDPVVSGDNNTSNPSYNSGTNTTVYESGSVIASGTRHSHTTEISKGDNRSSYAAPQGVTTTTSTTIGEGTPLATGLAATAAVAATTGVIFFIVAKRKKDDDEEDEEIDIG